MNDYIFPRATLAALLVIAGGTTSVNAATVDHVGNFNFRVEVGGSTAGAWSSVFDGRHVTIDLDESMDVFGTGELEGGPLYTGSETVSVNPLATGGIANVSPITEITLEKLLFRSIADGSGENSISMDMFIFDEAGGVYASTDRVRMRGVWTQGNGRDHSVTMILQADMVFSNGGSTEWILEAGSQLRLIGVPAPAAVTPLMAGLVAAGRRRRN